MSRRALQALLIALAGLCPIAAGAQTPAAKPEAASSTYEVVRGDTLYGIARRLRPQDVSAAQMVLALYRANPEAFVGGSVNQLRVGSRLTVPTREEALKVAAADAAREVNALASAPAPVAAPAKDPAPRPPVAAVAPVPPKGGLTPQDAERRYQEGLAQERRGNERAAFRAFLDAGESGHGQAQRRLGEMYDKGNTVVARDYEAAIRWYQKAREQGVEIPKPAQRAPALR